MWEGAFSKGWAFVCMATDLFPKADNVHIHLLLLQSLGQSDHLQHMYVNEVHVESITVQKTCFLLTSFSPSWIGLPTKTTILIFWLRFWRCFRANYIRIREYFIKGGRWVGIHTLYTVFSPTYLRDIGPICFQYWCFFDVEMGQGQKLWCGIRLHLSPTLPIHLYPWLREDNVVSVHVCV